MDDLELYTQKELEELIDGIEEDVNSESKSCEENTKKE